MKTITTQQSLKSILSTLFLIVGSFSCAIADSMPQSDRTFYEPLDINDGAQVSAKISDYVLEREAGLASVAVAVFAKDETVCEQYFGYADIDKKINADDETVYEWGSSSKLLVWTSVMQLWEDGKLDLDCDVREYLPSDFAGRLKFKKPVTMTQLMNHTAGFQECLYENSHAEEDDIRPLDETLLAMEPLQVYEPGTVTAYSNWGNALAAFVVQCISGEEYADYVHHHILEPLGMNRTAVSGTHNDNSWAKQKREELQTYTINSEGREDYGSRVAYVELYPAGAAISPLGDFLVFAKALADKNGTSLFRKPDTMKVFHSVTSFYGDSAYPKNCHGFWTMYYGTRLIGHGGNTYGCSANLVIDPENESGIVVMANESGETAFNYGLVELVFGSMAEDSVLHEDDVSPDISGFYLSSRDFIKGFMRITQYTYFMPIFRTDDPNVYRLPFDGKVKYLGNKRYLMDNGNGMSVMLYLKYDNNSRPVLEMETMNYIRDPFFIPVVVFIGLMYVLALVCLIILIVKGVKMIVARKREYPGRSATSHKLSLLGLVIPVVVVVVASLLVFSGSRIVKNFAFVSAIFAGLVCLISVVNSVYLFKKKHWFVAATGMYVSFFIVFFHFCNFWSL